MKKIKANQVPLLELALPHHTWWGFFLRGDGGKLITLNKVNEYWLRRIEWQTVVIVELKW